MNNLFKAIDSLFESETDIVLGKKALRESKLEERGAKYLKTDPSNEYNDVDDRGISKPKDKTDYRYRNNSLLKPGFERYLYDVVKHLNPAGYAIYFNDDSWSHNKGTYTICLKGSDDNNYRIGKLKISINDNDEVEVTTEPLNDRFGVPNIFGHKASMKEIGQQLAREKGANYDEDFVIDNGAEIRERFNNQKSEGTVEELLAKIEKQIKKLPSNKLIAYTESAETKTNDNLTEAFSDSCPNWLKMALKSKNKDRGPYQVLYSDTTEFTPVPTDKIKGKNGLTTLSREAEANGEQIFVRTNRGVFGFYDNKWRSIKNRDYYLSSEEIADSIIAAVKTTNKQASGNDMSDLRKDRAEARKGSIERNTKDAGHWNYDKSGYEINPTKYRDMLRDLNKSKLANSDLINSLKQEDYADRFNEIGKKAVEFIKDSLDISYDKTQRYGGFNTQIIDKVKTYASEAKDAIEDLMNKVKYIKNDEDRYYDRPRGVDVETWVKEAMEKADQALNRFEQAVTKAEEMSESIKLIGDQLNESEYTPNARKCIDAANLLGQINLRDIEDAAKLQTQIDRLFDKLVKLAPKLNKKEQKEIEEANKYDEECNDSSEIVNDSSEIVNDSI